MGDSVVSSINDGEFESAAMNAMNDLATINRFAVRLEDIEARRYGVSQAKARAKIASRIGIAPSTLENIRRLRTKIVPNWLMARIRSEFIAVLQTEVARLENEIHLARQIGMDHRDDDLAAAEAQLVAAKEILKGAGR